MKKRGQVWVETVIYTLIALTLIAAVLAFAKPKIEESQDKIIIEDSVKLLGRIDSEIISIIQGGEGNQRNLEIVLRKGELLVDGVNDNIVFNIKSLYQYSEPGIEVINGNVKGLTEKIGDENRIKLMLNYSNYDLKYSDEDKESIINPSSETQRIIISNKGEVNGKTIINLQLK
jgi:hypothetical protein